MRIWSTIPALLLGAQPYLALAHPAPPQTIDVTATRAHNIYLVTCVPRNRNNDDGPSPTANFTAIAYFRQPLNVTTVDPDTKAPKPDKAALVAQPPEPWEGVRWKVKVWNDKLFSASIAADAATGAKGALAGDATLGDEDYVCFKDGETGIRIREDNARGNCVAGYWCAGLEDGKG
jgi:hypothetical protein